MPRSTAIKTPRAKKPPKQKIERLTGRKKKPWHGRYPFPAPLRRPYRVGYVAETGLYYAVQHGAIKVYKKEEGKHKRYFVRSVAAYFAHECIAKAAARQLNEIASRKPGGFSSLEWIEGTGKAIGKHQWLTLRKSPPDSDPIPVGERDKDTCDGCQEWYKRDDMTVTHIYGNVVSRCHDCQLKHEAYLAKIIAPDIKPDAERKPTAVWSGEYVEGTDGEPKRILEPEEREQWEARFSAGGELRHPMESYSAERYEKPN